MAMIIRLIATALCAAWLASPPLAAAARAAQPPAEDAQILALMRSIEEALLAGDAAIYRALVAPSVDRDDLGSFEVIEFRPGATRAVLQERDRQRLAGTPPGYRVMVDTFVEYGDRARIGTWLLDIARGDAGWHISGQERLAAVDNLYRLSVNPAKQFEARNFSIRSEDLELRVTDGPVFVVETDQGVTGLVITGRGDMRFTPKPETEKTQVRLFTGQDALHTRFDGLYIRAGSMNMHADLSQLIERPVDPRDLRRADELFREESPKTYSLELGDFSRENWSLLPAAGDFVSEVRTRRFDTLTYARALSEPEDISLFDRRRQRNISVYASEQKLATRGRFYHENDYATYDILDYDIDLAFTPQRLWLEGRTKMRIRMRAASNQINLKLAETLAVHSVVGSGFGRLFSLRVRGQNSLLVNVPATLMSDYELTLTIDYAGRLQPQTADREVVQPQPGDGQRPRPSGGFTEIGLPSGEPHYLYSNRSYWYPQSAISDFATGTMRISVPASLTCIGSGEPASYSPTIVESPDGDRSRRLYTFTATRPVRYLAFLVSRFSRADSATIGFDEIDDPERRLTALDTGSSDGPSPALTASPGPLLAGAISDTLDLAVEANPLQVPRGRQLMERLVDMARFYRALIGDSPYESFTLALIENVLPGGHSPGYFAALNQPLPNTPLVWRTDPAHFSDYSDFFLAHEVAHQWWGQAVGWQNYHEQWLSEGFAQYFAALYARHHRGDDVFGELMQQMRRWALDRSDQGPVYLGYRLGHVKNDSRTFRALVYNKGAAVLHMLRGLIGDDAFFRGMRRFYLGARFNKVGTDDLRFAMEAESGKSLDRFFDRWIYGSSLPALTLSHRVESSAAGAELVLRVEQGDQIFDLPVVVTVELSDRRKFEVLIPVTDRVAEQRVAIDGSVRRVDVADEQGIVAEIRKR